MDFISKMNAAINYIEEHLMDECDFEEVAKCAQTSNFQFQRMFSFLVGVPIAEYVRRRRLTLAAFELQNTELRIIDIAVKYGYDSHESFTRAFQKLHNIPPSISRKQGVSLKAFPKLTFNLSVKGDIEMNYKIEKKQSFKMFGKEKVINMTNGQNFVEVPEFWQECFKNGSVDALEDASGIIITDEYEGPFPVHAIMCHRDTGKDTFPYLIGCLLLEGSHPGSHDVVEIPALEWAIFTTVPYTMEGTTAAVQDLWKRIYTEWFPTSGYESAEGPQLELYCKGKGTQEYCEIWIPVKK